MLPVEQPFKIYTGLDGKALDNGYIYFGQPNLNPLTYPITVFWDAAGTVPAAQPLRTVNGYIMRAGTPANVFVNGAYSETVLDSKRRQVFYARTSDEFSIAAVVSGFISKLATAVGSTLMVWSNGGIPITVERALDILYHGTVNVLNPRFAGGADPTSATDSTAAIQAAVDYWIANGGLLHIPYGIYAVDTIKIKDAVYVHQVQSDGAFFVGTAKQQRNGVFDIVNCVDFTWMGSTHIFCQDNANYDAGMYVRAETGTSQATSRVNIHNVTVRNAKIAFCIGVYTIDYQCSEISFFGCNSFKCPSGVYIGGSQTGASFNGCNIVSEVNAAFPGVPNRIIWMEGGFATFVGGELAKSETAEGQAILLNPCSSATYGNLYPILRITGAHIETQSQLLAIANSRGLAVPDSRSANVAITNCGGYVSGNAAAQDLFFIGDASYVGALAVKLCNFYSDVARTGYNISSAAAGARISVDSDSFGRNFKNWMSGVYGGILDHEMSPIAIINGLSATLPAGEQLCKFINVANTGLFSRYGVWYGNGLFTAKLGLKTLTFSASIVGAAGTGDFYIKQNGVIVAFGIYNGVGHVEATIYGVKDGDTFGVYLSASAAKTFDGAAYQALTISGTTRA